MWKRSLNHDPAQVGCAAGESDIFKKWEGNYENEKVVEKEEEEEGGRGD